MEPNYVENSYLRLHIKKDGILYAEYAQDLKVTLEIAKECIAMRLRFTEDRFYPCLANVSGIVSTSKEAREYFASEEALRGFKALAILTHSTISKIIGNFYINFDKPGVPSKIFNSEKTALKWLKQFQESE